MALPVRGPGDESRWHYRKSAALWIARHDTLEDKRPRRVVQRYDYLLGKPYFVVLGSVVQVKEDDESAEW